MTNFDLTKEQRAEVLEILIRDLEDYYENTGNFRVTPTLDPVSVRELVRSRDLTGQEDIRDAVKRVTEALKSHTVHITHPMYYGLFNPRANFPSIMADLISAYFNPQLAAWSH